MGVDLFFVMSGFLITRILLGLKEKGKGFFGPFYARRARRILPPYLLFIVFSTIVIPVAWKHIWFYYAFFAANVAEMLGVGGGRALAPLWSLAVEEQFYLVWPFVVLLTSRKNLKRICLVGVFALPIIRALATPYVSFSVIYHMTFFRMDLLMAGSFVGMVWDEDRSKVMSYQRMAGVMTLIVPLAILALARIPSFRTGANSVLFNGVGYSLALVMFTSVLVYSLSIREGMVFRLLTSGLLTYLGRISYMMYLVHATMIVLVEKLALHGHKGLVVESAIALAATVAFASLSWKFVEGPILNAGHVPPKLTNVAAAS